MASDGAVIAMVVTATVINVAGTQIEPWIGVTDHPSKTQQEAWQAHNHNALSPIIGGFIVGGLLLAVASKEPLLAELFGTAFLITSLTLNGRPFIRALQNLPNVIH